MKKITCNELGGPAECGLEITGTTPDEMAKYCKEHVMEEIEKGDSAHQEAVQKMMSLSPEDQQAKMTEYMQICEDACKRD